MSDIIILASAEEISAQRALWLIEERQKTLKKISEDYKVSEEKRKIARPWSKTAKRLAEEDEKFARVDWKKFEDPTYYGLQVGRRSKAK